MSLRYVCPRCQGSGKNYGFKLLSFIKCKICDGDGHVIMSINMKPDNGPLKQKAEEEVSS
ncbi:hypothetical protein [Bacillus sp. 165]|uniref:hypothetical protein n=1 Tax=Bacillus sp. 165 TaxID=1529117 RepID=UPI001ADA7EC6|nr:hypothetical protein [Bacillus sp. 165]MBO9131402.1 hypothetical protein [Bacillus sp. 165]